jgi:hypothetical protein
MITRRSKMRKYIFILIGLLVIASTDIEAYRRRRGRRKRKTKPVMRVSTWKEEPKLLSFEIRPEFFWHSFSMGDYNAFKEEMNKDIQKDTLWTKLYPNFGGGWGLDLEFSCFYKEMMGVGIGIGGMEGNIGDGYEDRYTSVIMGDTFDVKKYYNHDARTSPLLFTFYYIPPLPLPIRLTTGLGVGFYFSSASFLIEDRMTKREGNVDRILYDYSTNAQSLNGTGFGFHFGARADYSILSWLSLYGDIKLRIAKVSSLEGEVEAEMYSSVPPLLIDTTYTYTGVLVFDKEDKEYFGPAPKKDPEELKKRGYREGSVDFSGFKIGAGILFRF